MMRSHCFIVMDRRVTAAGRDGLMPMARAWAGHHAGETVLR